MTGVVHCLTGDFIMSATKDQDRFKGAVEAEEKGGTDNTSMQGQLGHRDQDPMLKDADTDFPEPGGSPEHTGEPEHDSSAA
jgi:hypothetical protein